jgi:hypothetical protein
MNHRPPVTSETGAAARRGSGAGCASADNGFEVTVIEQDVRTNQ